MYYSYVEIEYVATSFSPARTDLALKLLITICYKTYCNSYIANSSVARARVVAWLEPEPIWSNGPRHIGYCRKALVIARMINALE
jgi:hypothetical protein